MGSGKTTTVRVSMISGAEFILQMALAPGTSQRRGAREENTRIQFSGIKQTFGRRIIRKKYCKKHAFMRQHL
jgi:hypothetical protein